MLRQPGFEAHRCSMVEVKICGIKYVEDARACVDAGADAIGLNFWPGTPRCVVIDRAREIVEAIGDKTLIVGVFVDSPIDRVRRVLRETGIGWAQLQGQETPEMVSALLPKAYKALGVKDRGVIETARRYPGEHLLLDASVPGVPGGTGRTFDWTIATQIARQRKLTLAGGLNPSNVAEAVRMARPFRVDVASGVESEPGRKDVELVRAFVDAAKSVT